MSAILFTKTISYRIRCLCPKAVKMSMYYLLVMVIYEWYHFDLRWIIKIENGQFSHGYIFKIKQWFWFPKFVKLQIFVLWLKFSEIWYLFRKTNGFHFWNKISLVRIFYVPDEQNSDFLDRLHIYLRFFGWKIYIVRIIGL